MNGKRGPSGHPLDGIGQLTGWRFWLSSVVLMVVVIGSYYLVAHIDSGPCDALLSVESEVTADAVEHWAMEQGITLAPQPTNSSATRGDTTGNDVINNKAKRFYVISLKQKGNQPCFEILEERAGVLEGAEIQRRQQS